MLTLKQRRAYMKALGYPYTKVGIKQMQSDYFTRSKSKDGKYGTETDILLKNLYNLLIYNKGGHISPKEIRCECGGRYCNGFPTVFHQVQIDHLEKIRAIKGNPMKITCGLRCTGYNRVLNGSVSNSKHLKGYATDFYIKGLTDTPDNRKNAIAKIRKLKHHTYTYGNGYNSLKQRVYAPYMGNALHSDTDSTIKDVYPSEVK